MLPTRPVWHQVPRIKVGCTVGKRPQDPFPDPPLWPRTFNDFWRIPMGKPFVGSVVSHRRKSGCGFTILSSAFSSSISHFTKRWQFCSISHRPRATAFSSSCRATWGDAGGESVRNGRAEAEEQRIRHRDPSEGGRHCSQWRG